MSGRRAPHYCGLLTLFDREKFFINGAISLMGRGGHYTWTTLTESQILVFTVDGSVGIILYNSFVKFRIEVSQTMTSNKRPAT